jgi:hypothetical protein
MKYNNPCVYTLSDPFTNEIKYIGSTTTRMCNKLATHLFDSKTRCSHLTSDWIKSLLKKGLKPNIYVLEYCEAHERLNLERFYIVYLHSLGIPLLNITYIRKPNRSKTLTTEHRNKLSKSKTGKSVPNNRKKVGQHDNDGNLIKIWDGVINAQNQMNCKSISVTIKKHGRAAGYIWKYL